MEIAKLPVHSDLSTACLSSLNFLPKIQHPTYSYPLLFSTILLCPFRTLIAFCTKSLIFVCVDYRDRNKLSSMNTSICFEIFWLPAFLADHEQLISLAKSYCTLIVQSSHCASLCFLLKTPFAAWYFLSELLGKRGLCRISLLTSSAHPQTWQNLELWRFLITEHPSKYSNKDRSLAWIFHTISPNLL